VAGVLEHVEAAGVHSGDSACVIPPYDTGPGVVAELEDQTAALARGLGAVGLLNVQFAVQGGRVYVLEANPRASRTVPFVAKATGMPLVRHAVRLMLGERLADLDLPAPGRSRLAAVKEAVLPFDRFPGADPVLGPEMRATGEVMGIADSFGAAFGKAQRAAGQALPREGVVFISACDPDKPRAVAAAARLARCGMRLVATRGTARALAAAGLEVEPVNKVSEGSPHVVEQIAAGRIALVINTPSGRGAHADGAEIRRAAIRANVPCITTMEAAEAAAEAIRSAAGAASAPVALQDVAAGERPRSMAPSAGA
jgi:carbamoyl-phosphate synthase large subunit